MSKNYATWSITLNTRCPKCEEYFDLIELDDDFWVDAKYEACERDTRNTRDVEVDCPECGHNFKVDFCY